MNPSLNVNVETNSKTKKERWTNNNGYNDLLYTATFPRTYRNKLIHLAVVVIVVVVVVVVASVFESEVRLVVADYL
ncbi:Hypothetical predicted protein [Octopus vulgaris]|uniref:Transmembrane protein n=1 Tax=Octopus vulgaris TaxID=6645 RepID=A0AA36AEV6_OCTVU|nr:Hypothetical predicted protein [Octopus vulgaris]